MPSASTSRPSPEVVLYGATGYTGRLAARSMARAGLPMILGGRNRHSLEEMRHEFDDEYPVRVAAHDDPAALRELVRGAGALVTTAGPFGEVGELVVAAAVEAGVSYVDSTGEVDFMAQCFRRHHDAARARGIAVINACAFEYVLGDCAVELAMQAYPQTKHIQVSYWTSSKSISHGTALTLTRMLTGPEFRRTPVTSRQVDFPAPAGRRWAVTYPGGEAELLPRRRPGVAIETLLDMPAPMARSARITPVLTAALRLPGVKRVVDAQIRRMPAGPSAADRPQQEFVILVEADPGGPQRGVVVTGADPYGLTGEILARCAARLSRGEHRVSGVLAPSEAFEPGELLDSLADLGVAWRTI